MDDSFNELEKAAWGGLMGMHGRLMRLIEADLQEHARITHVEFEVLMRLSWEENRRLRLQDLAAQSILTRSGISRVVERLEDAGLVIRERADEDRRGAYAILTDAGLERFRMAERSHVACVRRYFINYFDEEELRQMATFWLRVYRMHSTPE